MENRIKPEYRELVKILSCFLHDEKYALPLSDDCDPAVLKKLADQHSISGIVGYELHQGMDEWAEAFYATCSETVQRMSAFKILEKNLNKAEIPHLMVKGFALREFYPFPQLRTFGDLDVVIHSEDRMRCDELLRELGYICEEDWEPSYSYSKGNEFYEFQTELLDKDPIDNADFRDLLSDPWKHAIKMEDYRYELDPEFCFLYVFIHLAKHISVQGAGLRMYLDLAVLLQKNLAEWKKVQEYVAEIKMGKFFETTLSAVETWFGVSVPFEYHRINEQLLEELLVFTMKGGTFGRYGEDHGTMMLRESGGGKAGLILKEAFPSADTISDRYIYLKNRPWLLPFAWVHRLILNRGRIKREGILLKQIASSDSKLVEQMKEFYKSIGL